MDNLFRITKDNVNNYFTEYNKNISIPKEKKLKPNKHIKNQKNNLNKSNKLNSIFDNVDDIQNQQKQFNNSGQITPHTHNIQINNNCEINKK